MTWQEFKEWVESHGVTDEMEIAWFDFSYPDIDDFEKGRIEVIVHDDGQSFIVM